jgi:hypothetical protein
LLESNVSRIGLGHLLIALEAISAISSEFNAWVAMSCDLAI